MSDDFYKGMYDKCYNQLVEEMGKTSALSFKLEMRERELEIVHDILNSSKEKTVEDILSDVEEAHWTAFNEVTDKLLEKHKD